MILQISEGRNESIILRCLTTLYKNEDDKIPHLHTKDFCICVQDNHIFILSNNWHKMKIQKNDYQTKNDMSKERELVMKAKPEEAHIICIDLDDRAEIKKETEEAMRKIKESKEAKGD